MWIIITHSNENSQHCSRLYGERLPIEILAQHFRAKTSTAFHENVWQNRWSVHIWRDENSFKCKQLIHPPLNSSESAFHHVPIETEQKEVINWHEKFLPRNSFLHRRRWFLWWNILSSPCWHFFNIDIRGLDKYSVGTTDDGRKHFSCFFPDLWFSFFLPSIDFLSSW